MELPNWATHEVFIICLMLVNGFFSAARETVIKFYGAKSQTVFNSNAIGFLMFAPLLLFIEPPNIESFIWIALGGTACGIGLSLRLWAYQKAEAGSVYPIFKAFQALVIVIFGLIVFQEYLNLIEVIAVTIVLISIMMVYWRPQDKLPKLDLGLLIILLSSTFIALYTSFDAVGVRQSNLPFNYIAYTVAISTVPPMILAIFTQGKKVVPHFTKTWKCDLLPAIFGNLSIVIDVYVLFVAAMAEMVIYGKSSILFVMLLSTIFLKEDLIVRRLLGCIGILIGIILLISD